MKKPGTILLMAVVLGALVSAWVYNLIRSKERQVEAARRAAAGDTIELVVAASEIPIGARIEASQLRTTRWPLDAEPEGAVKKPEDAIGQIQFAQHQRFRVGGDTTETGLQEQRDEPATDPARREAVAPGVQDNASQSAIGAVDCQGLPVVVIRHQYSARP